MTTRIHDAITALTAGFTSVGVPNLTITDGPDWDPANLALQVAWSPVDAEAVQATRVLANAAATWNREQIAIDCLLSVSSGQSSTTPMTDVRATLVDAFNQLEEWLYANPTLDGAVALAVVTSLGFLPDRAESSALAEFRFTVTVTAV